MSEHGGKNLFIGRLMKLFSGAPTTGEKLTGDYDSL